MSKISEICRQYHDALSASQAQYQDLYQDRVAATETFYRDFFHRLVCDFGERFRSERFRARLQERIEHTVGTRQIQFIAIDGTCQREIFSDWITFFGGAYGARGELDLNGGAHQIQPVDETMKTVLITDANDRISREIARQLLAFGHRIPPQGRKQFSVTGYSTTVGC